MADKKINGSLEITGKLNPNASGYGFNLPSNSSLTADKTIATEKYVDNALLSKADLVNGRVPSTQLPSYVDDVLNISSIETIYSKLSELPDVTAQNNGVVYLCVNSNQEDEESLKLVDSSIWAVGFLIENVLQEDGTVKWQYKSTLEPHKIYVVLDTNKTFRYTMAGETHLVEISASLALGETAGSAYAGDKGKANADEIARLKEKTFNVINASDIVNNTLTQEQYNLITNGKPTLIKGTFFNKLNPIILSGYIGASSYFANMLGIETSAVAYINGLVINKTTLVCSVQSNNFTINMAGNTVGINGNVDIKGKRLPENPTINTSPQVLTISANGGALSWENHMTEWYGTQAEYDALGAYDNNTIYNITEE